MSKISTLSLIFGLSSGIFFNLANANTKEMKGDKMENKKEVRGGKATQKETDNKKKAKKDTKKKMQEEKKY
jgi:hypothetical protein